MRRQLTLCQLLEPSFTLLFLCLPHCQGLPSGIGSNSMHCRPRDEESDPPDQLYAPTTRNLSAVIFAYPNKARSWDSRSLSKASPSFLFDLSLIPVQCINPHTLLPRSFSIGLLLEMLGCCSSTTFPFPLLNVHPGIAFLPVRKSVPHSNIIQKAKEGELDLEDVREPKTV
ncbi:uncharacterized protein BDV17DRAFT_186765 [Aspergillus undulatus]|uniref:uncharacterized protein n=1 Tax=Aspergillus undulatus TaxID=1810928 RepID=UPI003CCE16CC